MCVSRRTAVCLAMVGALAGLGGCVSSATHKSVLAQLDQARAARDALECQFRDSQNENTRLVAGLTELSDRCRFAQTRVRSLDKALANLKADQRGLAETLDKLNQQVSAQTGSTAALGAATSPLIGEIDDLQAKAAALLGRDASQSQRGSEATAMNTRPTLGGR